MANHPEYIVWHTAAHGANGVDHDTTAAQIDAWHRDKGWAGIGYNYVIRKNGAVEDGRDESKVGAHTIGLNARSIGICFSGHGDIAAHTQAQRAAGLKLTRELMAKYGIAADHVIGHREVNKLVAAGKLGADCRTSKTCPGTLVNMDEVRAALSADATPYVYSDAAAESLITHLRGVYAAVQQLELAEEAMTELNAFRREPHVDAVIEQFRTAHPDEVGAADH